MPGTLLQATFATGGSITVNDDIAVAAIAALTTALTSNLSVAATNVAGTPAANLAVSAGALNDISTILASMLKEQKAINSNLQIITTALTGMSSNLATGVTTSQLAYIDQTKNNAFNQTTTNAALKRADLPPTVVTTGELGEKVKSTVSDVANLNVQSQVATTTNQGFAYVQGLSTQGLAWTFGKAQAYVAGTGIGQTVKGWIDKIFPSVKEKTVEVNSAGRATFIGQAPTKPVPIDPPAPTLSA